MLALAPLALAENPPQDPAPSPAPDAGPAQIERAPSGAVAGEAGYPWRERGLTFDKRRRGGLPRPTDVWSVLRDVPGVVLDRVNVGGSDTAQQSLLFGHGDPGTGAVWTLDGVDITDPASLGFTALYPDTDALAAIEARTSALDVRVRTPGVQVGLVLPDPPAALSAAAHLRGTDDALQADNLPASLEGRPFFRNRTTRLLEAGFEIGGPVRKERLWLWGAASRNALTQRTFTEHAERLSTTSVALKARLRLADGQLTLLALRSEKVHEERDTGVNAAPEARWRQSGPAYLFSLRDQRKIGGFAVHARLAYLDAGFRLEPNGGAAADPYEDARGVFRGSYYTYRTDRDRLQAMVEATSGSRFLGFDHELLAGAGYRRMPVSTRLSWPGNQVLGLTRQSVFFRAFRLTGFALPTRDLRARSVHDTAELFLEDRARKGRFTLDLGLSLERLAGRNLDSAVAANPVVPELLPAVRYSGAPRAFRWLDALPRAALAWDVTGDGDLRALFSYAAYAGPLGAGEIGFDNPIGRDYATLGYYWIDRNGDRSVQRDELDTLRGQLLASGLNPEDPASTTSPNVIDPDLRSPRTHEWAAAVEADLGRVLAAGLRFSYRRNLRALWRPLRNLGLPDYVARGSVRGRLFDREYAVVYFAPASESQIVSGDGRLLTNREGYHQDALTLEGMLGGSVGSRVDWEAWGAWLDFRERFDDPERSIQDPTPLDTEPLRNAGFVAARPGGLGRGDVFVSARWTASASVQGRLPWRLEAALLAHARDGFPVPYFEVANTGDPTGGAKNVLVSPSLGSYRLPRLLLFDARLARGFRLGRGTLVAEADIFNLLNRSTTLQLPRDVELPAFGRPREIVRPRLVRVGFAYSF